MSEPAPFTWSQGQAARIPRRAMENGRGFRQIVHGVYVPADLEVDAEVEGRAALLVAGPRAFLSHHQAARLYGAIVPDTPVLHASVAPGLTRSTHREVLVHQSRRAPQRFRGLPITSPEDTFADMARCVPLVELVVLGDSLVRRHRTTPDELVAAMSRPNGGGIRLARRAATLVRARVDSAMETRSRMLRVLSGLPELETDIRFHDAAGNLLRRLDAGDRATRTAVEYDGRHHVERVGQWESDLVRREEFEDEQWRVVTLISRDLYVTPGRTVARLDRIFRARGMRYPPLREEWRRHFRDRSTSL